VPISNSWDAWVERGDGARSDERARGGQARTIGFAFGLVEGGRNGGLQAEPFSPTSCASIPPVSRVSRRRARTLTWRPSFYLQGTRTSRTADMHLRLGTHVVQFNRFGAAITRGTTSVPRCANVGPRWEARRKVGGEFPGGKVEPVSRGELLRRFSPAKNRRKELRARKSRFCGKNPRGSATAKTAGGARPLSLWTGCLTAADDFFTAGLASSLRETRPRFTWGEP